MSNTNNAITAVSALEAMPAADRQALLTNLLSQAAMPASKTPAQKAAEAGPVNSVAGIKAGQAGSRAKEGATPGFRYTTSAIVAGGDYRTNAAGLYTTLLALVGLGDGVWTYQEAAVQAEKLGAKRNNDVAWCGTRDLTDIGLLVASSVGRRKGHTATEAGVQHATTVLAASAKLEKPVWVCPITSQVVDAASGEVLCDLADLATPKTEEAAEKPATEEPKTEEQPAPAAEPKAKKAAKKAK